MNGGDIIIKGGSVDLIFDDSVYLPNPQDRKSHTTSTQRITRVVITGDMGDVDFDSGEHPQGLRCMITVFTR